MHLCAAISVCFFVVETRCDRESLCSQRCLEGDALGCCGAYEMRLGDMGP